MKVKTLLASLAYTIDEVEMYDRNDGLISRMAPDTLRSEYGDMKVRKFWIFVDDDNELVVLEVTL